MRRDPVRDLWVPMPVGRADGPVPYIFDVTDRITEYQRYW